jgi:putative acetyltransferase
MRSNQEAKVLNLVCRSDLLSKYQSSMKGPVLAVREEFIVRAETLTDEAAIHALHLQAFGQETEARLVDELQAEGFATLSLVAVVGVRVIGHVLFSPIEIVSPGQTVRALALAPVGVMPGWQRRGVAATLIRTGLAQATWTGEKIVIVVGDPAYYRRFGFRPELASALQSPYAGEHFMALELSPGALEGVTGEVRYSAPFQRLG